MTTVVESLKQAGQTPSAIHMLASAMKLCLKASSAINNLSSDQVNLDGPGAEDAAQDERAPSTSRHEKRRKGRGSNSRMKPRSRNELGHGIQVGDCL